MPWLVLVVALGAGAQGMTEIRYVYDPAGNLLQVTRGFAVASNDAQEPIVSALATVERLERLPDAQPGRRAGTVTGDSRHPAERQPHDAGASSADPQAKETSQ